MRDSPFKVLGLDMIDDVALALVGEPPAHGADPLGPGVLPAGVAAQLRHAHLCNK